MGNPYKRLHAILRETAVDSQAAAHAFLATVFEECCEKCCARIHTEEFFAAYEHMINELQLCKSLAKRNVA